MGGRSGSQPQKRRKGDVSTPEGENGNWEESGFPLWRSGSLVAAGRVSLMARR